jgi:hypothetical protein
VLPYVLTPRDAAEARRGKIVVRSGLIERRRDGGARVRSAGVVTTGLVEMMTLCDRGRYQVVSGVL